MVGRVCLPLGPEDSTAVGSSMNQAHTVSAMIVYDDIDSMYFTMIMKASTADGRTKKKCFQGWQLSL